MKITAEILTGIAPSCTGDRAIKVADALNKICPMYGIDTPDIMHEFIARICVESGEFKTMVESLNYQASALLVKFSRERISIADCNRYGRTANQKANVQAIANCIYGGDWGKKNLGNIMIGDGYNFRGSGLMQLTGRGIITAFCKFFNEKFLVHNTPEEIAESLREDLSISVHGACWFFAVFKKLIPEAIDDKIDVIVKKINGGYNGLAETKVYLQRAIQYIK